MRAAVQAGDQAPVIRIEHTCLSPQIQLGDQEREERRRIRELLLLFHDSEGYGRHSEYDRWKLYKVLNVPFLDCKRDAFVGGYTYVHLRRAVFVASFSSSVI